MKLLIADDEIQIRTGLKEGIDWSKLDILEVYDASDGIEALEIYMEQKPDIVITDIRMPGMDGLELSRRIKEISGLTQIIILSGYADFDYAKRAIQLGVTDYELKPVKMRDLIRLVTSARDKVIEEKKKREEEKRHEQAFKRKFLEDLLSGRISNNQDIKEGLKKYFYLHGDEIFLCLTVEMDDYDGLSRNADNGKQEGRLDGVGDFICNQLEGYRRNVCKIAENELVLLLSLESNFNVSGLSVELKELHRRINEQTGAEGEISYSIGVSHTGIAGKLPQIYLQSVKALKHKLHLGKKSIVFYQDMDSENENNHLRIINEKGLRDGIGRYDFKSVSENISMEFDALKQKKCTDINLIKNICMDLKNVLIRTIRDDGVDFEGLFGNNLTYFNDMKSFETIDEYKKWVLDLYYLVITGLTDIKGVKNNSLMLKAAEYIRKNYNRDLTIEELADYVQKSPNYFSHLFKKEFGVSYSEYLNKLRINEAKNLMKTTSMLAYEIAEKTGFQDYKYFVYVFKKIEGYAPSEYRKHGPK